MSFYKYSVVGGVVIPNYIKKFAALTGCAGCLGYCYAHEMNSKYGVKLPDRLTWLMTGTGTFAAGFTVCDIYRTTVDLARVRDMDKMEFANIIAGKFPKWYIPFIAGPVFLVSGAFAMATAAGFEMYSFHKDFMKERAMEGNSAKERIEKKRSGMDSEDGSS